MKMLSYREMLQFETFEDRFEYLSQCSKVGESTFGYDRFMNQDFYRSTMWKKIRNKIIVRDSGCDLGIPGMEIQGKIYIHHINPINLDDLVRSSSLLLDEDNLVCVSFDTHQAIHFSDKSLLPQMPVARTPNDTCPWRK